MPNLKDLRTRINSVKSTQKITSAMKMVAAAKLRRAQEHVEAARPYAERMERMLGSLAKAAAGQQGAPKLLAGTGREDIHLLVVGSADRGLCGGMHANLNRRVDQFIREQQAPVRVIAVGRKGRDFVVRTGQDVQAVFTGLGERPELADTIKSAHPETRVLYMTGYADEEVLSEPLRDRKVVLLKKPFSLASIIEKIGEALEVES